MRARHPWPKFTLASIIQVVNMETGFKSTILWDESLPYPIDGA